MPKKEKNYVLLVPGTYHIIKIFDLLSLSYSKSMAASSGNLKIQIWCLKSPFFLYNY